MAVSASKHPGASQAAPHLGHPTSTGTVSPARRPADAIREHRSASQAATHLGHATYTGTVAPAARRETSQGGSR